MIELTMWSDVRFDIKVNMKTMKNSKYERGVKHACEGKWAFDTGMEK